MGGSRLTRTLAATLTALVVAGAMAGSVSDVIFRIDVDNGIESASFEVNVNSPHVSYDPMTNTWSWDSSMQFIDLGNVASLDQATLTIVGDPQISLGFALTAGAHDTTVTITSAVLSFAPLSNAEGVASVAMTVTDNNGNGATATGVGGSGNSAYAAFYNVPPGSIFGEFIDSVTAPPGMSGTSGGNTGGFVPFPVAVSSMQVQYSFVLSAGDQASGTSNYVVIPEPAALALLLVGAVTVLGRRR